MSAPKFNIRKSRLAGVMLFWFLVAVFSAGLTFSCWNADNTISRQLSAKSLIVTSLSNPSSSFRTLSIETRDKKGEGVLDEPTKVITGYKVEAFNFINRLPSFYRLRSHTKTAKNHQCGIVKLPNSQLALNQILRI